MIKTNCDWLDGSHDGEPCKRFDDGKYYPRTCNKVFRDGLYYFRGKSPCHSQPDSRDASELPLNLIVGGHIDEPVTPCKITDTPKRRQPMNSESQVPTLETCKKLKAAGYPQGESYWAWVKLRKIGSKEATWRVGQRIVYQGGIAAPSVAELGEWLPEYISGVGERKFFCITKGWRGWYCGYKEDGHRDGEFWDKFTAPTQAEACGLMALWLLEESRLTKE